MAPNDDGATARARRIADLWQDRPHLAKLPINTAAGYRWVSLPDLGDGPVSIAASSDGAIKVLPGRPDGDIATFFGGEPVVRGGDIVGRLLTRPYNDLPGAVSFLRRVANRIKPGSGATLDNADAEGVMREYLGAAAIYASMRKSIPDFLAGRTGAPAADAAKAMEAEYNTGATTLARDIVAGIASRAIDVDAEMAMNLPFSMMIAAEHSRVQYLMDHLTSGLDYEVLRAMHQAGRGDDGLAYRWYAENGEKAVWRRQAMRSYGMFAPDIARLSYLREKIDAGESVQDWIKGIVPKEMAPLTQKRVFAQNPNLHGLSQAAFLTALAEVQPDWVPKDVEEMQALADIVCATAQMRAETGLTFGGLVKESRGKWLALRTKLLSLSAVRLPEGVTAAGMPAALQAKASLTKIAATDRRLAAAICDKVSDAVTASIMAAERAAGGEGAAQVNSTQVAYWLSNQVCPEMDISAASQTLSEATGVARQFSHQVILPAASAAFKRSAIILSDAVADESLRMSVHTMFAGRGISYIADVLNKYRVEIQRATTLATMPPPDQGVVAINEPRPTPTPAITPAAVALRLSAGFDFSMNIGLAARFIDKHWAPMFLRPFMAYDGSGGKAPPDPDGGVVGAIYAVPLWYDTLLRHEGASELDPNGVPGLEICVGWNGYDLKCMRGGHIVSFREYLGPDRYRRLGCLELSEPRHAADGCVEVRNLQFRGHRNTTNFNYATRAACENFMLAVTSGALPLNWGAISDKLSFVGPLAAQHAALPPQQTRRVEFSVARGDADRVRDLAGYDPASGPIAAAMLEAWKPIAPGLSGCRTLNDVPRAIPGLAEISTAMSPQAKSVSKVLSSLPKLTV